MGQFEYLLLFVSVIMGLAVSDLAISLNRLLDAGKRVRWDWLTPMAAAVAFLKIITQWWAWFGAKQIAAGLTFGMFLGLLIGGVLVFLMAAAALPDSVDEPIVDLRAHYARVSRRYWLLFAAHWTLLNGVGIWAQMQIEGARFTLLSPYSAAYVLLPVSLVLAFVRNRWLHTLCLAALVVLYVVQFFGRGLGQ
jgi:hypothetical protein